jgi:cyclic-di-GMP-binding protein
MPSFDVVSKVDQHELQNVIDQASREITNRFDFKGSNAKFELAKDVITMVAPSDFQLKQMDDILRNKMAKRDVDAKSLKYSDPEVSLHEARQNLTVQQGIETDIGKKITKAIKEKKLKVQASIQGDQVRLTGKKRDDLQEAIAFLKEQDFPLPLQFENFRD